MWFYKRRRSSSVSSMSRLWTSSWPNMRQTWATYIRNMLSLLPRSTPTPQFVHCYKIQISKCRTGQPVFSSFHFSRPLRWWRTLRKLWLSSDSSSWTVNIKDTNKSGYDLGISSGGMCLFVIVQMPAVKVTKATLGLSCHSITSVILYLFCSTSF